MLYKSVHKPILLKPASSGSYICHETIFTLINNTCPDCRNGAGAAAEGGRRSARQDGVGSGINRTSNGNTGNEARTETD